MKKIATKTVVHFLLIIFCLFTLVPILFTFSLSFKLPRDIISGNLFDFKPTLDNYRELFLSSRNNFINLTFNSLIAGLGSTFLVLVIACPAAYTLGRMPFRRGIKAFFIGWFLFVHMLPPIIFIGPFYLIARQLNIYDTPLAVIMGHIILNLPLAIFILIDFFHNVPREMEESAFVDGATRTQSFFLIVLPIVKPGISAAAILAFIFSWKDFLYALSLTSTKAGMTIPVGIAMFVQEFNVRYGEMSAAACYASIPAMILIIIAQKHIIKGMTLGALKG